MTHGSAFESTTFDVETIDLAGTTESIVRGGRHLFPRLPDALEGVRQISVIGWGPQGRAQALNLRDSLRGSPIRVAVGLRPGSASMAAAEAEGFDPADGTLGPWPEVAAAGDLVLVLISDAAQVAHHAELFEQVRPGATIGFSHGFLAGYLDTIGVDFPADRNVIAVCPKGMGDSVRRLYLQGAEVNGAGINASFAAMRDLDGRSTDRALAWSIGIGSPYTFHTTLAREYRSDIVGERAILLGAVHGIVESLYQRYRIAGDGPARAFGRSAEAVTGVVAPLISRSGLRAVRDALPDAARRVFDTAYAAAYGPFRDLTVELYDEVDSGNELRSVVLAERRLATTPMTEVARSAMWTVGRAGRSRAAGGGNGGGGRDESGIAELEPFTAGIFVAAMVALIDVLAERGHSWSEIVNESVIEAVDSLLPFMHARDVASMVDNCSVTARLGARKWGPRFQALLDQVVYPIADAGPDAGQKAGSDAGLVEAFTRHPVHDVLKTLATYRPAVDISVG